MKINWKVLLAIALLVTVSVWAVDGIRTRSYEGIQLNIPIGKGSVAVTNLSEAAVPVQLLGTGSRPFSVSSDIQGITGSSTRAGSGRSMTQLYEFSLPQGVSNLTVAGGTGVNLLTNSTDQLEATVQPLNDEETRTRLIITALVVLASLFYIVRATRHGWLKVLQPNRVSESETSSLTTVSATPQSHPMRAYGDNRADISER